MSSEPWIAITEKGGGHCIIIQDQLPEAEATLPWHTHSIFPVKLVKEILTGTERKIDTSQLIGDFDRWFLVTDDRRK